MSAAAITAGAVLLGAGALCAAGWYLVTQPLSPQVRGKKTGENVSGADPARLEAHVRALAETFAPRDHEHPENLEKVAAYVQREFAQAGGRVAEQPFQAGGQTYQNVIASWGPEGGERVVVGAHYDAAGPYPGADDNASGVAGLLELAHLLGAGASPTLRVDLVAFCLEEPPYFATDRMGSAVHAASLKREGVRVRAMLCMEMIGYFTDVPNSQQFPIPAMKPFYPSVGNFITVAGRPDDAELTRRVKAVMREAGGDALPVHSVTAPASLQGLDFSDHRNYWAAGYPAVMITDSAFFRNPHYHTREDTPDTLDYRRMALVVDGLYNATLAEAK
jgi:hypothetical protein